MIFRTGNFKLHGGTQSRFKIDCDTLDEDDWHTVAAWLSEQLRPFASVEGVPTGGLRLASALRPYATTGPVLIVDDVLTTGASMEQQRAGRDAIGAVLFARGPYPLWITPLFTNSSIISRDLERLWQKLLEPLLEPQAPNDPIGRVIAFMRLYAERLQNNKQWDVPQTMGRALDGAANSIESYVGTSDAEQIVREYGKSKGIENFTIHELIQSHQRQGETIRDWRKYVKAGNAFMDAFKDA